MHFPNTITHTLACLLCYTTEASKLSWLWRSTGIPDGYIRPVCVCVCTCTYVCFPDVCNFLSDWVKSSSKPECIIASAGGGWSEKVILFCLCVSFCQLQMCVWKHQRVPPITIIQHHCLLTAGWIIYHILFMMIWSYHVIVPLISVRPGCN